MNTWDRFWFSPVAAIRPYLFQKCFLLLIATDTVVLMTERGARYGVDGFNVAHFRWLESIQPLPTASWYVGILMLVATLALLQFFLGSTPLRASLLALLYTYSWAMSRHDSYLHHYMSSLILAALVFFPRLTAPQLIDEAAQRRVSSTRKGRGKRRAAQDAVPALGDLSPTKLWIWTLAAWLITLVYRANPVWNTGWLPLGCYLVILIGLFAWTWRGTSETPQPLASAAGYRLLGTTVGIIYLYTSLAKCDAQWCSGYTIRSVGRVTEVLGPVASLVESLGIPAAAFWATVATAVIPLETTIAVSYFLAAGQDHPERRWRRRFCSVAWCLALALHLNNEMMGLSIQWFSFYMVFLAMFFLPPASFLWRLGSLILWPAARFGTRLHDRIEAWHRKTPGAALGTLVLIATGSMALATMTGALPGMMWGFQFVTVIVLVWALFDTARGRGARACWHLISLAGAGLYLSLLMVTSTVQFDYYNLLGKTHQKLLDELDFLDDPADSSTLTRTPGEATPDAAVTNQNASLQRSHQQLAIEAFHEALGFGTPRRADRVELLTNLGLAYRQIGQYEAAIRTYRSAVAEDPRAFLAYYNLGVCLQYEGRDDEALRAFAEALRIKGDLSDALVNRAVIFARQRDWEAARRELLAAQRIEPEAADIQALLEEVESAARRGADPDDKSP